MNIIDEHNIVTQLVDIAAPVRSEYFWVLDLTMRDYTLAPLAVLEEVTCPTFVVEVAGVLFDLPASWNMLIYDGETSDVDLVPLCEMTGQTFTALGFGPSRALAKPLPVRIMDYKQYSRNVGPSLNKHQMLCHPITDDLWFTISAADVYTKYLKNVTLGDILQ